MMITNTTTFAVTGMPDLDQGKSMDVFGERIMATGSLGQLS
jgi:hypothetical protein